ncbi:bifunctional adenosylcobinamide kinase/adenosylcobinamide-phosphate guanylyltransferase [Nocardioides sp.]|uniref:bifunctional adenosylcobinamide kinase/adenosylcobinamide-phosphate guanylyltransferase n=1 Tax=Nocardioides sp. TaxID=35761 RepID=UPI0026079257|nr:bifunctional adenosylcobinamide kinase/adenosylcobinamide-phosphate guanylyltransferase [Nocardioides sp.]
MKVLVTGGVRSGKSRHAEELLIDAPTPITYVAPGPTPDEDTDPDWLARIEAHRASRPGSWTTLESRDLAAALATDGSVIVDCLGTWLTALLDSAELWEASSADALAAVTAALDSAVAALEARSSEETIVLVTNEVGLGVVPAHRSGRLFRDLLGVTNQRLAAVCDEVHLVIAGRVLTL